MFHRQITNSFFSALDSITCGQIKVHTPDGRCRSFKGAQPGASACLNIHDWRMIGGMIRNGDIGLAQSYRDGWWDSADLVQLFRFGLENQDALDRCIYGSIFGRLLARTGYLFARNTLMGSKKNITAHYDLGNEFYALWLDQTMTYSSAIFDGQSDNLAVAQHRKYDRIIERLSASGRMLEVGCGWGGFAERAQQQGDYDIKGLTISPAQHEFATKRLGGNATIALEDYRNQEGSYDQIVSIEMFEAVGENFWPVYFGKLKALLANKGKAIVQTITIADNAFEKYRTSGDAIRTFIFPGGMLPCPARFREESTKAGLRVLDEFFFGQDYGLTLTHWLKNFDAKIHDVKALGFDDRFVRLWRFYLTSCIATFSHGRTDVMQWELQHAA